MSSIENRAATTRMLALDVDGVLTDGRIYYSNNGDELKAFNIKDGLGIKLLRDSGVKVAIITGRQSEIVALRARELGIEDVVQGRDDKHQALLELCQRHKLDIAQCAYMGDDLPDLSAIAAAGLGMTVADACAAVCETADWISHANGGCGAVREACEFILSARDEWSALESGFA
jgi:3-deoxy-D-manno-octulosonate 8-phosphate phosphatase (KDO 8-P phosphatase)